MIDRYRTLNHMFGSYLHQDWDIDAGSWNAAVCQFIDDSDDETVITAQNELAELIEDICSGRVENNFLKNFLGCYYDFESDNMSSSEWLREIRKIMLTRRRQV